jgi:hypothetical protein
MGKDMCLTECAQITGIYRGTLAARIKSLGYVEAAVNAPNRYRKVAKLIEAIDTP